MVDQLDCALDLMRRLPPTNIEYNLAGLIDLVPDLTERLLSAVDQPLRIAHDRNLKEITSFVTITEMETPIDLHGPTSMTHHLMMELYHQMHFATSKFKPMKLLTFTEIYILKEVFLQYTAGISMVVSLQSSSLKKPKIKQRRVSQ